MPDYEKERIAQLHDLGLTYNMKEDAFLKEGTTIYVPMLDVTCDDDKTFNDRFYKLKQHINKLNELKDKQ